MIAYISYPIASIGRFVLCFFQRLGRITLFSGYATINILLPPYKIERVIEQLYFIGVSSVFVVVVTGIFTGMVLGLQGYYTLSKFGSEGLLGGVVALSLIRELGPVLAALMVTGQAGSSIAANLGTMRISEQIDALDTMDINPMLYLVSPRIAASILSMPLLTAMFDLVGIFGGYVSGVVILGLNTGAYFSGVIVNTKMDDVTEGLMKSLFFGFIIGSISCFRGFHCDSLDRYTKGSASVSKATTSSVVMISVSILIIDYVITAFLI